MDRFRSVFWDDLAEELEDPESRRTYIEVSAEIQAYDALVNRQRESDEGASH